MRLLFKGLVVGIWIPLMGCPDPKPQEPTDTAPDTGVQQHDAVTFQAPESCQDCHPVQYEEWQGSAMHAASSPTFAAFELAMNRITNGAFAHGSGTPNENFCSGCHIPNAVLGEELAPFEDVQNLTPSIEQANPESLVGVNCHFCHSVTDLDTAHSIAGDGLGTAKVLVHEAEEAMQGPYTTAFSPHGAEENTLFTTSNFCGTCHDVRSPKPDVVTGEPFLRVEETFTEWQESDWAIGGGNSPISEPVTCQGCHMSDYPNLAPNSRPTMAVTSVPGVPDREHANHNFTAVSVALHTDPAIPQVDAFDVDGDGVLQTQAARRESMLQAACTMVVGAGTTKKLQASTQVLRVAFDITNVGAGHDVPSGFSQEREMWVELTLTDSGGTVVYRSGYLVDSAHPSTGEAQPDGLLHDEDLLHRSYAIDPDTLGGEISDGPDADQRPNGVNLGLVYFNNDFEYIDPNTGETSVVLTPFHANHVNNDRAIAAFETRQALYDIPIDIQSIQGDVTVEARLLFRAFPPKFLRLLNHHAPHLVTEEMVDNNTIVEMATSEFTIRNMLSP